MIVENVRGLLTLYVPPFNNSLKNPFVDVFHDVIQTFIGGISAQFWIRAYSPPLRSLMLLWKRPLLKLFQLRFMTSGPSCEQFDGWLTSDSKNRLSPACQAKGTRLCVSMEVQTGRTLLFTSIGWRCCMGATQNPAMPNQGAALKRCRSIRSKWPPSKSFHCCTSLSCFIFG